MKTQKTAPLEHEGPQQKRQITQHMHPNARIVWLSVGALQWGVEAWANTFPLASCDNPLRFSFAKRHIG